MRLNQLIAVAVLALAGWAAQAGDMAGSVQIIEPYARAVPPGQPNSAAFMMLKNSGGDAALVSAESPVSKVVELHTHINDNGMMRMRQVPKIDLPGGETTTLKPGGLHVMMIGLHEQLKPGQLVSLKLNFADGSSAIVEAPVKKLQMKMKKMDHSKMQH